jgi:glycerophosphoryl diester phosphodiesterase
MVTWKAGPAIAALLMTSLLAQTAPPLVIAHRGASGHRPEHTIEAYTLAIEMGADAIEPDLVSTKDGVLVARHENEIGATTDVATKFPARRTTKHIDGKPIEGWFTEDFTWAELQTLRARERLAFRTHAYDGRFTIPTFDAVLELATAKSRQTGRPIAVYPETKHPSYFRGIGLPLEEALVARLRAHGLTSAASPVFVQSFESSSLQRLRPLTPVRLVQLTSSAADVTPPRLAQMTRWADGLGAEKRLVVPEGDDDRRTRAATSLVGDAHAAGLFIHVWTMRNEPTFLSPSYEGDPAAEIRLFLSLGVDGLFTDFPDVAAAVVKARRSPTAGRD